MTQALDPRDRIILITGGNGGIGFEAARVLAHRGAQLVLACRDLHRGQRACAELAPPARHAPICLQLDLASLASIKRCAGEFLERYPRLDVLINNAGVMAIPRLTTADGFEMQLGVNHLGHFALTGRLLRALGESTAPRVVTVSSMAHWAGRLAEDDLQGERHYGKWAAYNQSKLANLLFAFELQRRAAIHMPSLASVACHPGYAATNLQFVGPRMSGALLQGWVFRLGNRFVARPATSGARPTVHAATAAVTGGSFIGPRYLGYAGSPHPQRSSRLSRDPELARRLWSRSVELTGVDPGW